MESLLIGAAGGLIAGAILLLVEYFVRRAEKKRELADQRLVRFANEKRLITGSIFNYLGPRSSIELMRGELGPPNKKLKEPVSLFRDYNSTGDEQTNSYVYLFKNAAVKITSKDDVMIDSLAVVGNDTDIQCNNLFYVNTDTEPEFLNKAILTNEMLEGCRVEEFPGCNDCFAAAQKGNDNPFYVYITYFCDYSTDDDISANPQLLAGTVINGICLSSSAETASYVFANDVL
jgi:hypothetical protein